MNHRTVSILTSSALLLSVVLTPAVSLAATHGETNVQANTQTHAHAGFFAELANWFGFGARVALADTDDARSRNLPPSISGVSAPTVLTVGETGTWSVSASDPENGQLSYSVDWGDQMRPLFFAQSEAFVQTSTFTHAYAAPGTYTVKFTVKDDGGLTSSSSVTVHVTQAAQPFVISEVNATTSAPKHAQVSWKTNIRSDSTVFYSTQTPVDPSTALSVNKDGKVLNHTVNLNKLSPGTTYYFTVQSKDAAGDIATSTESSFTTPAPANQPPVIQSVSGPDTLQADTEGTWTVNASDPENGQLSYSVDWGDANMFGRMMALMIPGFAQTSTFTHT